MFLHGHGFWTSLENVIVGPFIAIISFVCSIGNVPLAAALWHGGISFGGVISFIFADLIAMPLILIYRKFYGTKLTVRVVGLFYVVMVIAGLLTQGIFNVFGGVPSRRAIGVAGAHFEWNYTSYLNFVFIAVAIAVWWLARNRAKYGGGIGYAIDPVCSMQVRTDDAPATAPHEGAIIYFCSDRCKERFVANPQRFVGAGATPEGMDPLNSIAEGIGEKPSPRTIPEIDPICGMTVDPATAAAHRSVGDRDYWFCSTGCAATFDDHGGQNGATDLEHGDPLYPKDSNSPRNDFGPRMR